MWVADQATRLLGQ